MYINGATKTSNILTELMEDVWRKRHHFLKSNEEKILLSYRLSVSDCENDKTINFFFNIVVTLDRWWLTKSDDFICGKSYKNLIFRETDDNRDWDSRVTSYRSYAFPDLVRPMIEKTVVDKIEELESHDNDVYLWDTLPIETFHG